MSGGDGNSLESTPTTPNEMKVDDLADDMDGNDGEDEDEAGGGASGRMGLRIVESCLVAPRRSAPLKIVESPLLPATSAATVKESVIVRHHPHPPHPPHPHHPDVIVLSHRHPSDILIHSGEVDIHP